MAYLRLLIVSYRSAAVICQLANPMLGLEFCREVSRCDYQQLFAAILLHKGTDGLGGSFTL